MGSRQNPQDRDIVGGLGFMKNRLWRNNTRNRMSEEKIILFSWVKYLPRRGNAASLLRFGLDKAGTGFEASVRGISPSHRRSEDLNE